MMPHSSPTRRETQLLFAQEGFAQPEETYRLAQLEVYNWGPFRGMHRAEFDAAGTAIIGTAIIGATGSGKTTLVDALMTLLVQKPRYNLASTGGHDKNDRTLLSYVRGVLGGDGSDGQEEVARPGKALTAIGATYCGVAHPISRHHQALRGPNRSHQLSLRRPPPTRQDQFSDSA